MLGWKILNEGEYELALPILSAEEEQVISLVEERFKEEARRSEFDSDKDVSNLLRQLLLEYSEAEGIMLDHDQLEYLSEMARLHIYGFGFLDVILQDPEIEEVSVIGLNKPVYVYVRREGWKKVNVMFTDEHTLMDVINKMAKHLGRRITLQKPKLNTILQDGSRLHATLPPLSEGEITLRKFSEKPFSPSDLISLKTMSAKALAALSFIMQADMSLVVSGNTASGKTTTLNMLFAFIPKNERVVLAEESPEIRIPHSQQVRLVANEEMGVSLKDLVYDSLRMRPDRFVVGEVRNKAETEALFDSLLGGQARGCYATFHAQSAPETFRRFSFFGVSELDFNSVNAVLVQRRMLRYDPKKKKNTEMRRMTELCFGPNHEVLFKYNPKKDTWEQGNLKGFSEAICASLGITEKEFETQLAEREKFIQKEKDFEEFFDSFQKKFYGL